jgi:hypothetical protein|tara:strand:- start:39 stop:203 length:165 start_codon:yes stop_codon:yes gene_type:complete
MQQLDKILMTAIARDINNGTLLTEADDETIEMVLVGIWEDIPSFTAQGIIIGEA